MTLRRLEDRLAGAPISWGVSEVEGWGHRMAPSRVLAEMRDLGLRATELGPPGYLPAGSARPALDGVGLGVAGAFLATVLHRPAARRRTLAAIRHHARELVGAGGTMLVLGAAIEPVENGYDSSHELDTAGWRALADTLRAAVDAAGELGVEVAVHPHLGTVVESPHHVARLLRDTEVGLCLDTGHLVAAGADPAAVARAAGERIRHVHLKDVDPVLAVRLRRAEIGVSAAVRAGLFRPLGEGEVDMQGLVRHLEAAGYRGWYVLEQDTALEAEPAAGAGPARSVGRSVAFMRALEGST